MEETSTDSSCATAARDDHGGAHDKRADDDPGAPRLAKHQDTQQRPHQRLEVREYSSAKHHRPYHLKTSSSGSSGTTTLLTLSRNYFHTFDGLDHSAPNHDHHGFTSSRSSVASCVPTSQVPMRVHRAAAHGIIKA